MSKCANWLLLLLLILTNGAILCCYVMLFRKSQSTGTISVAAQQFHITPMGMGPMTDVGVSQGILMVHQCHRMINFELGCAKILVI
jgi:hypothetical protein